MAVKIPGDGTIARQNLNISNVPEINSDDTRENMETDINSESDTAGFKDTHRQELDDVAPMEWEEVHCTYKEQFDLEEMDTSQSWFIVVDTNVILISPSFLNTLRGIYSKDHGESRVILPWVVVLELDNLKRKDSTRREAMAATRYLRTCVFDKEDPRMIGQRLSDHQSLNVPHNAVNDDYILATCVEISKSGMVTLLTNDVNLGLKAKFHKIDVKTSDEMKSYIENRCKYNNRDGEEVDNPVNGNSEPIEDVKMEDDEEKLNLLPELEKQLCTFVSKVVEKGMKNTYQNMWEKFCIRPPPWNLDDCLLCLKQHWIAIADNMDVPEINELIASFKKHRRGLKLTWSEIRDALYLCLRLFSSLPKEYSNCVDEFQCYFLDLQRKVNLILNKPRSS